MYKILIVDDEKDIVSFMREFFENENYQVLTAYNGTDAIKKVKKSPDIILLDINMPDYNGIEVCEIIRNQVNAPIIFLTARVDDRDKIEGFRVGGDDYVIKPFNLEVLASRVKAHLRRESRKNTSLCRKSFKEITIDYEEHILYVKNDKILFTKKEFEIIELLSKNAGNVFNKEHIYEKIWGYDAEGESSVIAEHIKRIRSKIAKKSHFDYIETIWGVGYKWVR
ncbi:MAG: response regulator transcription factor [Clostridiales bacterium]